MGSHSILGMEVFVFPQAVTEDEARHLGKGLMANRRDYDIARKRVGAG